MATIFNVTNVTVEQKRQGVLNNENEKGHQGHQG